MDWRPLFIFFCLFSLSFEELQLFLFVLPTFNITEKFSDTLEPSVRDEGRN